MEIAIAILNIYLSYGTFQSLIGSNGNCNQKQCVSPGEIFRFQSLIGSNGNCNGVQKEFNSNGSKFQSLIGSNGNCNKVCSVCQRSTV